MKSHNDIDPRDLRQAGVDVPTAPPPAPVTEQPPGGPWYQIDHPVFGVIGAYPVWPGPTKGGA